MDRNIKNCGEYVEINSDELTISLDKMEKSSIFVLVNTRIEVAGEDKQLLLNKIKNIIEKNSEELKNLDESQKSDYIIRKIIL